MTAAASRSGNRFIRFFYTRTGKIILVLLVLLIALRIALPYIILDFANRKLATMDGYYGHIDDIDVALLRGAYQIDSIYLNKVDDKGQQTEFFSAKMIDLSVEWKALFKGGITGELLFDHPRLRFVKDKAELDEVSKDTTDFRDLLRSLMPIRVNRAEIRQGTLSYLDPGSSPKVDVSMTNLNAVASNLRNEYQENEVLPADLNASADIYGGHLSLLMKMNPLTPRATFDMTLQVENTDLTRLNDFFQAYGNLDVAKGTFNMYTEAAAKNGKFTGYVKPIIKELDIVQWKKQDKEDNFFRKVWESLAEGVGKVFENQKQDQVATRIEFQGDLSNPDSNVWQTLAYIVRNAFIEALRPSIENAVSLDDVGKKAEKKGFFEGLFDGEKKKE